MEEINDPATDIRSWRAFVCRLARIGKHRIVLRCLLGPVGFGWSPYAVYAALSQILMVIAAIVLWIFPLSVAHKIIPRTKFENTINIAALEAARVGCALIGLLTLAHALPALFRLGAMAVVASGPSPAVAAWTADQKILVVTAAVQLAVAVASYSVVCFREVGAEARIGTGGGNA